MGPPLTQASLSEPDRFALVLQTPHPPAGVHQAVGLFEALCLILYNDNRQLRGLHELVCKYAQHSV